MMASVASVVFSTSDSNQRSRIGLAAPVRISRAVRPSRPSARKRQASCASFTRWRGASDHGSGGVSEEPWPGFKVSTASYVNSLFRPEIVRDLELARHGFAMIPRSPSSFTPLPDGRSLLMGPDKAMTAGEVGKFSARDAEALPRFDAMLERVARLIEPT